jgi:hypothetical protein
MLIRRLTPLSAVPNHALLGSEGETHPAWHAAGQSLSGSDLTGGDDGDAAVGVGTGARRLKRSESKFPTPTTCPRLFLPSKINFVSAISWPVGAVLERRSF